jgi:hypothetical protein
MTDLLRLLGNEALRANPELPRPLGKEGAVVLVLHMNARAKALADAGHREARELLDRTVAERVDRLRAERPDLSEAELRALDAERVERERALFPADCGHGDEGAGR